VEIKRIVQACIHGAWLIVLGAILGGIAGYYLYIYNAVTIYQAKATVFVFNQDKAVLEKPLNTGDISFSRQILTHYSGMFYSKTTIEEALQELSEYEITPERLSGMSSITIVKDSNVATVGTLSSDPDLAVDAANAMSAAFVRKINSLTRGHYASILDKAYKPFPRSNEGAKKTLILVFAGAAVALGGIYLREYFNTTVRSVEEIEQGLGMRVLGVVPDQNIR